MSNAEHTKKIIVVEPDKGKTVMTITKNPPMSQEIVIDVGKDNGGGDSTTLIVVTGVVVPVFIALVGWWLQSKWRRKK